MWDSRASICLFARHQYPHDGLCPLSMTRGHYPGADFRCGGRTMRFSAYALFISLWSLIVYAPLCHLWGGVGLQSLGRSICRWYGRPCERWRRWRRPSYSVVEDSDEPKPHNAFRDLRRLTPLVWLVWLQQWLSLGANALAAALLTTNLAAAGDGLWTLQNGCQVVHLPAMIGVVGLVTHAGKFVTPLGAIAMGAIGWWLRFTRLSAWSVSN